MLYFCCLFTPLPMETLKTPTFIGEIFGRKNIFGAIGLNCCFLKIKSTLNFNLFRAACQIESTLNFLRIRYFANTQNQAKLAIYAKNCKNRVTFYYSNTLQLKRFLILHVCSSYKASTVLFFTINDNLNSMVYFRNLPYAFLHWFYAF